jgi:acyl-coenzyme A synthetase/AMP-(fatty) acid ligase
MEAIHRRIEQQAVQRGDIPAVIDPGVTISYRTLNGRANALARHLIAAGLRRGGHAVVDLPAGAELLVGLLAVLKAGASYTWTPPGDGQSGSGISIRIDIGAPEQCLVSLRDEAATRSQASSNLPVMTRGSDTACALPAEGGGHALLPHASVVALAGMVPSEHGAWCGGDAALGAWRVLMSGETLTVGEGYAAAAA